MLQGFGLTVEFRVIRMDALELLRGVKRQAPKEYCRLKVAMPFAPSSVLLFLH